MCYSLNSPIEKVKLFQAVVFTTALLISTSGIAGPDDKVHAYYADEHNTSPTASTGNRILEIDLDTMSLVNTLDVPGSLGHHADNAFNSKLYGVPKNSGFVNVIELRKDQNNTTSMQNTKKINLIHKPRSGDAYNKKFNVVLMVASNRPMGSFINVETDEVVGTIGENIDCTLTDGTQLLSHDDANTIAAASKYECVSIDHGGDQISGHPYWLTPDYAAIVDRSNRQISVFHVIQKDGKLISSLVNHLKTRTSVHQIVPRDRTNLPDNEKADFYAVEEGNIGDETTYGTPQALIKMKLTTNGLQLVNRMDLQRTQATSKEKSDRILQGCREIYLKDRSILYPSSIPFSENPIWSFGERKQAYLDLFALEGINPSTTSQSKDNDFPIECLHAGIPGGHNADFAPDNKRLFVGMAGGVMSVIDVDQMHLINNIDSGFKSGPGHTCFSEKHNLAIVTNHKRTHHRIIANYDMVGITGRPTDGGRIELEDFGIITKEGLIDTYQSHTCYVDKSGDYYYNFFTDGGVFYKVSLENVAKWSYQANGERQFVVDSLYTGGIPIQGSYISLGNIKSDTTSVVFEANADIVNSGDSLISIDVLTNDTGIGLTLTSVDSSNHGTATVEGNSVLYQPRSGFSGTDEFWYKVTDSRGWYTWGQVLVTVTSTQAVAILEATGDSTSSDGSSITLDVLANDIGEELVLTEVEDSHFGTTSIEDGKIVYQPKTGSEGIDEFWYKVTDSRGWYTWGQILVAVTSNQPAVIFEANADTANSDGSSVTLNVLTNDVGDGLELTEVEKPNYGTATISDGKIIYQPKTGFVGTDEFWYKTTDLRGWYTWGQVLISVNNNQ